jgi:colicin import membrane protein
MSDMPVRERSDGYHLKGMVLISMLLHVMVLSLLFFSPSFPSPKLTFGPVYTVSLVSQPRNVLEQKSTSAVAKEIMAANRPETVLKKRMEPSDAVPIRSLETRKKLDPNIEKAMTEIRKKAAATTGEVKRPQVKAVPEQAAGSASQPASRPGDAEVNEQMRAYYAMIWSRIKERWALPQGILPGEALETVIDVTILRSGAVTKVNFEKRSGNRYFDESTMKALQKASPFPPLPAWIGDSSIDVGIRFHSSELRP